MSKNGSLGLRVILSAFFVSQLMLIIGSSNIAARTLSQDRGVSQTEFKLEIALPSSSRRSLKMVVPKSGRSLTLIRREELRITDPQLAAEFTALDLWAKTDGNAVKVILSIIFNDLSDEEWWYDKIEVMAGSLLIHEGESARLTELARFGIEPFEMRVMSARPVVFRPGEGPEILNRTKSLEVVRLEKALDYHLVLKNNSNKNIFAYTVSTSNSSLSVGGIGYVNMRAALAPGENSFEVHLEAEYVERSGITIPVLVFEDGTFEGEPYLAARFLVDGEGMRIQAPHVLRMIEQTLQVDDAELQTAFEKLETQLRVIPDAIDKQTAVDLLKSEYPAFESEKIDGLYEQLRRGLHRARELALTPMGDIKRRIRQERQREPAEQVATRAKLLREALMKIRNDLTTILKTKL